MNIFSADNESVYVVTRPGAGLFWFAAEGTEFFTSLAVIDVRVKGKNNTSLLPSVGGRYFYFTFGSFPAVISFEAIGGVQNCITDNNSINTLFYFAEINNPIIRFRPSLLLVGTRLFIGFLLEAEVSMNASADGFKLLRGKFTFSGVG